MIALLCFFLTLFASPFKPKTRLEAENAALRHQLIILWRMVRGHVRLTDGDRLFLVLLYRWFPTVLNAITIIRPETFVSGRGCPARAWSADRAGWHLSATAPPAAKRGEAGLATLWAFQRRTREGIRLGSLGLAPQDGGHLPVGPIATASGGKRGSDLTLYPLRPVPPSTPSPEGGAFLAQHCPDPCQFHSVFGHLAFFGQPAKCEVAHTSLPFSPFKV